MKLAGADRPQLKRDPFGSTAAQMSVQLSRNTQVGDVVEFETSDPALQGEMTITITLVDAEGGTDLLAVHDRLPRGLSTGDNEAGWTMSLAKLAALVERG